ncbi:hypothetical protein TWF730_005868 [Orbilia blumenaviensis]|uniref:F-box domain-containing protein n=1 Tax=Orbilia blumenaviensis TaxID=1796055 RepID=A0AAV9VL07_9PEZI
MRPKRTKKPVFVKTTSPNPTNMAPATKKRKAKAIDPLNPLRPSKKRIRSLRPRKDAIHPFTELPPEIQSRIMGFCDSKTLAAISLVNNYYRELSLRVMWETQPVETYIKNFKQLDEHEDLRLAVRHLAIRKQSAPNKSRFSGVAKRLQTRFPKNYFPGLQELTVEYDMASSDSFISVINTVSKYQPKRLKTMNITITYRMSRRYLSTLDNKDPRQDGIIYPTGLTTVNVEFLYSSYKLAFDPLKAFDANSETVKTARVCFSRWHPHFSLKRCPKVTTLITKQDQCDVVCANELFTKFPNTQHLVINAPYCGIVWVPADRSRLMGRYVDWRIFSSVKSVEIIYSNGIRYGRNKIELRDGVISNITYLVKQWISDGFMPELKVVDVLVRRFEYPSREDITEHSFTLKIELKDMVRVVTTDRITRYQEETFSEQLKAKEAEKEREKGKLETEEIGNTVLAQPVSV